MDILGYVIYGIGALVILAFLWSCVRKQQQESSDQTQDSVMNEKSHEIQEEMFDTESLAEPYINGSYDNGPEVESDNNEAYQEYASQLDKREEPTIDIHTCNEPELQTDIEPKIELEPKVELEEPQIEMDEPLETEKVSENNNNHIEKPVAEIVDEDFPTHIIAINIIAPRGQAFYGPDILSAFERNKLSLTQKQIYQADDANGQALFSVVSSIEPGTFDLNYMDKYATPGLTLFVDLNAVAEPKFAFKRMLTQAYQLSKELQGDLLDHRRQRLTESSVTEYLAQIKGIESVRSVLRQH